MDNNIEFELFEKKVYQPLVESLSEIIDLRAKRGVRYQLLSLLSLLFVSKLGGADRPAEIADWVSFRFVELKFLLNLSWKRAPHEVTWKRMLEKAIDATQVEEVFGKYLAEMSHDEAVGWNLDGKVVCSVRGEDDKQLHLLALQESRANLVVEQTALLEGENEISAGKRLLAQANLSGKIISGDAIFAQTELSRTVIEKGGDYLWKLRANQGNIYKLAVEHFEQGADKYLAKAESVDKGHGRIDERFLVTSFRVAGQIEFPYLEQVFRITRRSEEVKSGKVSEQTIYGITSLSVEKFSADDLLGLTRKHWRIENGLHYRRDVTFKEDEVQKKSFNGGQIMAAFNNLAIGILRKTGWENIAKARRFYEVFIAKGLDLITQPIIA
jgi:predicted transposase YbfD/YdcC